MKKFAAFLLVLSLLCPHSGHSDETPSCDTVLQACDKALNDQLKTNKMQKDVIASMETRTNVLVEQNNRLQSEAQAWYRNPLVIGPISFTVGALAAIYLTSRFSH